MNDGEQKRNDPCQMADFDLDSVFHPVNGGLEV